MSVNINDLVYNRPNPVYYNISDVDRVVEHLIYVCEALDVTYEFTYFTKNKADFLDNFTKMLNALNSCRSKAQELHLIFNNTPTVPNISSYNYVSANNVEKILRDMEQLIWSIERDVLYSGTFYSGQEVILH